MYSRPGRWFSRWLRSENSRETRVADKHLPMGQDIPLRRDLGLGTNNVDAGAIDRLPAGAPSQARALAAARVSQRRRPRYPRGSAARRHA